MTGGTRGRILDVAEELFLDRGVGNVSVVEIERASGLSAGSGAFYRHFTSKGELYVAVVRREIERVRAGASGLADGARPAPGDRSADLRTRMELVTRMRKLLVLMMRDDGRQPAAVSAMAEALLGVGHAAASPVAAGSDPLASELVVVLAQIGYVLAGEFFGADPFLVDADRFVAALAEMVEAIGPEE